MKLYSQFIRTKTESRIIGQPIEVIEDILYSSSDEMSASNGHRSEKDSGNESEPELSYKEFSKLKISPKPLHTRPTRFHSRVSAATQQTKSAPTSNDSNSSHTGISPSKLEYHTSADDGSEAASNTKGFTRCLRSSRVKQSNKVFSASICNKTNPSGKPEQNNNNNGHAQPQLTNTAHNRSHTEQRVLTLADLSKESRTLDTLSLTGADFNSEFNESDDELISINSDAASASICSPRLSSKRKRTTTLSADLEVESLFSAPSEDGSLSSVDNYISSDLSSEPDESPFNCDVPKKRQCRGSADEYRPYLDLEKMQDQVEERVGGSNSTRRKPTAIRVMCFTPIKMTPTLRSHTNRELMMNTSFCPLTPVEQPAACY